MRDERKGGWLSRLWSLVERLWTSLEALSLEALQGARAVGPSGAEDDAPSCPSRPLQQSGDSGR
jgi:hypothetical protein